MFHQYFFIHLKKNLDNLMNKKKKEIMSNKLTFNDYQENSSKTAVYPKDSALAYLSLGFINEAGEVAGKIKKFYRGDYELTEEKKNEILKEVGDSLWYMSELVTHLGGKLGDVAQQNIDKLKSRAERGVIKGDGDNR